MHVYSRSREQSPTIVVDWNIGNICFIKCSYCNPHFHGGTDPFPSLEAAKTFVDRLFLRHRASNRAITVSFVGGEPTQWDGLVDLCAHIRGHWHHTSVLTNAARPLDYWRTIAAVLTTASLSFHPHAVSASHFLGVATILRDQGVRVALVFPMHPTTFDTSRVAMESAQAVGFACQMQALYREHTSRRTHLDYTPEQRAILFKDQDTKDFVIGNGGDIGSTEEAIFRKDNAFQGFRCNAGIDQLVIFQNGDIYGSWCRSGGPLGNIHDENFAAPASALICPRPTCNNPLDLSIPKWRDDKH